MFLSHDADPNLESTLGTSPLSLAVHEAPIDVTQLLLGHDGSTKYGQFIIHAARKSYLMLLTLSSLFLTSVHT